jgi:hypothetical protein
MRGRNVGYLAHCHIDEVQPMLDRSENARELASPPIRDTRIIYGNQPLLQQSREHTSLD